MFANHQTSGTMEKTLLANPCAVSYDHLIFIVSLEDCIVTYVDILAYFNIFRMKNKYAGFKDHPFSQRTKVGQMKRSGAVRLSWSMRLCHATNPLSTSHSVAQICRWSSTASPSYNGRVMARAETQSVTGKSPVL